MKFRIVERAIGIDKETDNVITGFYPEYSENIETDKRWINIGYVLKGYTKHYPTEKEALHIIDEFKIKCRIYNHPERIIEVE